MKIWILGAGGQLGRAVMQVCSKERIPFIASTRSGVDITDLEQLKVAGESVEPTHIINCAAYTDVDGAEKNHAGGLEYNALGAEDVGIVGRELGVKIVHVSTDYVFGGDKETPYLETDRASPLGDLRQEQMGRGTAASRSDGKRLYCPHLLGLWPSW